VKRILVVDDEFANAEILALILEDEGYEVSCAANGREGLKRVQEFRPDLVVLDFMMPVLSGGEMGKALRSAPDTQGIKILMNSALPESSVRLHFSDYDAYLRKPYQIKSALETIGRLLNSYGPGADETG
jgi:CheY-like chemotaxis protein